MLDIKQILWIQKYYPNYLIILVGDPNQLPLVGEGENKKGWKSLKIDLNFKLNKDYRCTDVNL
jgi:hypothetical protein